MQPHQRLISYSHHCLIYVISDIFNNIKQPIVSEHGIKSIKREIRGTFTTPLTHEGKRDDERADTQVRPFRMMAISSFIGVTKSEDIGLKPWNSVGKENRGTFTTPLTHEDKSDAGTADTQVCPFRMMAVSGFIGVTKSEDIGLKPWNSVGGDRSPRPESFRDGVIIL